MMSALHSNSYANIVSMSVQRLSLTSGLVKTEVARLDWQAACVQVLFSLKMC